MKNKYLFFIIFLCSTIIINSYSQKKDKKDYHAWWEGGYKWPKENPQAKILPLIRVEGNKLINENGDTILFRGLNISDPDKIENQGYWSKYHFEKVKEMGAKIIRIPVHPIAWRERTPDKYLELLDEAVAWCTELEMYVIIDWHTIGNLGMELFQHEMYNTTKKETYEFWKNIAFHFRGHNTIAFYEIFNEPTLFRGMLGSMTWAEWKKINEDIINIIRSMDKETIPLVAGFDWAYDLNHLHYDPVDAENIAYVTHPYPMKRKEPWPPKWEENFGFAADKYPIIATEIGFRLKEDELVDENHYGNIITKYLESRGIGWVAWVFDPEWRPNMLKSWDTYELVGHGVFFKEALQREPNK
ncbi:glycoside hydrolase family 5 protein [Bacteroidota bacterium]